MGAERILTKLNNISLLYFSASIKVRAKNFLEWYNLDKEQHV